MSRNLLKGMQDNLLEYFPLIMQEEDISQGAL
jgi:hypothetical protein